MKNGGRTPTLAKVSKVMCHSKENLRKDSREMSPILKGVSKYY
jgi:hypothetical protein